MPNGDEHLASNSDNSFVGVLTAQFEMFVLRFPVRVRTNRAPGGFNHGPAELLTAAFGDAFALMFLTTVVNPRAKASIADQVLGMFKAEDVADSRENGHRKDNAEARDLHEEDHIISPGLAVAQAGQLLMNGFFMSGEMFKDEQILVNLKADDGRELLMLPPGAIIFGEKRAIRGNEIKAVDEAVQAVLGHGDLFMDAPSVRDQRAQVSDMVGRHPDLGDDVSDEQSEQAFDIEPISFDLGTSDFADFQGIGNNSLGDKRVDEIVDVPGVGSGFDDNSICGREVLLKPRREARHTNSTSAKKPLLLTVHTANDDIMFVNVDGDETKDRY